MEGGKEGGMCLSVALTQGSEERGRIKRKIERGRGQRLDRGWREGCVASTQAAAFLQPAVAPRPPSLTHHQASLLIRGLSLN